MKKRKEKLENDRPIPNFEIMKIEVRAKTRPVSKGTMRVYREAGSKVKTLPGGDLLAYDLNSVYTIN